ncbi:hypothetical protein JST97_09315 [bacterium]|nr:hypothetical protein [bacterium]
MHSFQPEDPTRRAARRLPSDQLPGWRRYMPVKLNPKAHVHTLWVVQAASKARRSGRTLQG